MEVSGIIESIENKLLNIYAKDGFTNIRVTLENGSNKGDGYVALVLRAFVIAEKNEKITKMETIIKCALTAQKVRKVMPMTQFFRREVFFYSTLIPWYQKIQDDANIPEDLKCKFCFCVRACDEHLKEFVALENLKIKGYGICEKSDYKHAKKAFQMLSKLHALSLVFENLHKNEFDGIISKIRSNIFFDIVEEYDCSGFCNYLEKASKKFINCIENQDHRYLVEAAIGKDFCGVMTQLMASGKLKVINHGDFWLNNMFFKYQNGEPVSVIPIDFQMIRYESPMIDFLYFIGGSSDADLRRNHFWELFDVYYDGFKEFINACGYDVEDFCSYEDMKKELYNQSLYGIFSSVFLLPFFTSDEIMEPHEIMSGNYPECFLVDNETYKKRVNDLVADFVDWGFLK